MVVSWHFPLDIIMDLHALKTASGSLSWSFVSFGRARAAIRGSVAKPEDRSGWWVDRVCIKPFPFLRPCSPPPLNRPLVVKHFLK